MIDYFTAGAVVYFAAEAVNLLRLSNPVFDSYEKDTEKARLTLHYDSLKKLRIFSPVVAYMKKRTLKQLEERLAEIEAGSPEREMETAEDLYRRVSDPMCDDV